MKAADLLGQAQKVVNDYNGSFTAKALGFLGVSTEAELSGAMSRAYAVYAAVVILLFLMAILYFWLKASFKRGAYVLLALIDLILIAVLAVNHFEWQAYIICATPMVTWFAISNAWKNMT